MVIQCDAIINEVLQVPHFCPNYSFLVIAQSDPFSLISFHHFVKVHTSFTFQQEVTVVPEHPACLKVFLNFFICEGIRGPDFSHILSFIFSYILINAILYFIVEFLNVDVVIFANLNFSLFVVGIRMLEI